MSPFTGLDEMVDWGTVLATFWLWGSTLLWGLFAHAGCFEGLYEWRKNKASFLRRQNRDDVGAIISKQRFRRSRNFFIGFGIAVVAFYLAVVFQIFFPPLEPVSVTSGILRIILIGMLCFFWLGKHADRSGRKEARDYAVVHRKRLPEVEQRLGRAFLLRDGEETSDTGYNEPDPVVQDIEENSEGNGCEK